MIIIMMIMIIIKHCIKGVPLHYTVYYRGLCMKEQHNITLADEKPQDKHVENDNRYLCPK